MSARSTISALTHSRQANQLKEQLQGLLPDSAKPVAEAAAEGAGAGLRTLLDYATLAAEYREPITNLVQRLIGRAPARAVSATPPPPPPRRRGAWRSVAAVSLVLGIAAFAYGYGVSRPSRGAARNA